MRLAFVVPRYGLEVVGGAELACRLLAERLAASDHEVEVLTTCAKDATTWTNAYDPGEQRINGIRVRRFPSVAERDAGFLELSARVLASPADASRDDEDEWIRQQGPVSPALVNAITEVDADVVSFSPYLYHPTVEGIRRTTRPVVLQPAAHDEAPIHLPVYREVFKRAGGLAFYTHTERAFAERLFPIAAQPQSVVGLGVDSPPDTATSFSERVRGRPYLLCLGRVDEGKGTALLARLFAAYKQLRPGPLCLALVGPIVHAPPPDADIITTGAVSDEEKWAAIRSAVAFVSPSPFESFSIALMEAWACRIPALVNANCDVTRDHCARSGGGLWFGRFGEFVVAVDGLVTSPTLRRRLGDAGSSYVQRHYTWRQVTTRYTALLRAVAGAEGGAGRGSSAKVTW